MIARAQPGAAQSMLEESMAYFVVPPNSSNPVYDVNDADGPGWYGT